MAADYGFRSGAGRLYEDHYGEVPSNVLELVSWLCATWYASCSTFQEQGPFPLQAA